LRANGGSGVLLGHEVADDASVAAGLLVGQEADRHRGVRCFPLTVLDDHSRYQLAAEACADEREPTVRGRLETVFRRYGLPDAILTDNGAPWGVPAAPNGIGLTRLGVWLLRLGITPLHSRPRHPQTLGKLERLHRSLKSEFLEGRRFRDFDHVQDGLDRWRRHHNHERPHEALGGGVPASRYRMSERAMPATLPEPVYLDDDTIGRIRPNGCLHWRAARHAPRLDLQISSAFAGQTVAVRPTTTDGVFHVHFATWRIADVDLTQDPKRPSVTHVLVRL
jgi:hypothetical protein